MITIHDNVYGTISLTEPVLEELLESNALRRLQHVSQSGVSGLLGIAPDFTRYEHSVGVMLLLRLLGASLREQIAGLLHDISHTAFSHVADFIYPHPESSYHERMWAPVVERSRIPEILERYGYEWREMEADRGDFTLLEQPQPLLCADRVDYFLRTIVPSRLGTGKQVRWLLSHLRTHEGLIVVDDLEAAQWMGYAYLRMDEKMWSSPREVALYWLLAHAMRHAVEEGYLHEDDLYRTDRDLWEKLHRIREPRIEKLLSYLEPGTVVLRNEEQHDFVTATKVRAIDPPVLVDGEPVSLSRLDRAFRKQREAHIRERSGSMALWVTRPGGEPRRYVSQVA